MSVLVKGMEMPKDCPFCPMSPWTATSRLAGCNVVSGKRFVPDTDRDFWDSSTRPDWCPLVEMKEGEVE